MKILIDFWVDGYDTEEEMEKACLGYLDDTLNGTATSLKILDLNNEKLEWFKKGIAQVARPLSNGRGDNLGVCVMLPGGPIPLTELYSMADSGTIGPLKKDPAHD